MSSRVLAEGSAIVPPLNTLRVLFAGHDMEMGYFFTKEAAATLDPNIEVPHARSHTSPHLFLCLYNPAISQLHFHMRVHNRWCV